MTRVAGALFIDRGPAIPRVARWATSVLLLVIAGVHLNLYAGEGYRLIPTVGWLFLLTSIVAVVAAIAVVVDARPIVAVVVSLFSLSVLGGYVLTLALPHGLFDFRESGISDSGLATILAEVGTAFAVGIGLLVAHRSAGRSGALDQSLGRVPGAAERAFYPRSTARAVGASTLAEDGTTAKCGESVPRSGRTKLRGRDSNSQPSG